MHKKLVGLLGEIAILLGMLCMFIPSFTIDKLGALLAIRNLFSEIGAVFVGVGIIHLVYEKFARAENLEFIRETIKKALWEGLQEDKGIANLGIKKVMPSLNHRDLGNLLQESKEEIKILKTWFPEDAYVLDGLKHAVAKGIKVHFYLCNPMSALLEARCIGANWTLSQAALQIHDAISLMFEDIASTNPPEPARVTVTLYDAWPGVPVILCDEQLYVGFYMRGGQSPEWPWIVVDPESTFGKKLKDQFKSFEWYLKKEKQPRFLKNRLDVEQWRKEVTPWWTQHMGGAPPWEATSTAGVADDMRLQEGMEQPSVG
jgi:hypothetical protein